MHKKTEPKYATIDFVGVAGAGKSTLAKELIFILQEKQMPLIDLTMGNGKYTKGIYNKFKNALHIVPSLYLVFLLKPGSIYDFVTLFKAVYGLCIMKRVLDNSGDGDKIRVFDEGLFKRIGGMIEHSGVSNPVNILNNYLKFIKMPYFIIILEAEYANIAERRMSRGLKIDKRFARKFKDGTAKYTKGVPEEFEKILTRPDKIVHEDIEIIRLKNNQAEDLSKNAHFIIELLQKKNAGNRE